MPDLPPHPRRLDSLDGLRGIAIILVVLSHGWTLWPTSFINDHAWAEPFFRSGDSAVTIFLVASGFLLYRSISATGEQVQMQPLTVAVRRVIRVGPAMWVMLVAVMVVAAIDSTDTATKRVNRDSLWHAVTYSYNWLVQDRLTGTRMDLGHLWYVSVDMQAVVVVALLCFFLRQRPTALLVVLSVLFLALVAWRFHSFAIENIWIVLNRTTVRMDPFILGVLGAAVLPRLPRPQGDTYRIAGLCCLALLVPTLWWCYRDAQYLRWGGTVLELLVTAFLVCTALEGPRHHPVLGSTLLGGLGRMSLVIYIWHFPIFYFVRRHGGDWGWPWKVVVALVATAAICWITQLVVERPVARLLRHPSWDVLRQHGGLATLVQERTHRVTTRG